jgi:hypothetical protein
LNMKTPTQTKTKKIWPQARRNVRDAALLRQILEDANEKGRCFLDTRALSASDRHVALRSIDRCVRLGDLRPLEKFEVGGATAKRVVAHVRAGDFIAVQLCFMAAFNPCLKKWDPVPKRLLTIGQ